MKAMACVLHYSTSLRLLIVKYLFLQNLVQISYCYRENYLQHEAKLRVL